VASAVYENGTHFVANHKLTLEMLKEISDFDGELEVAGEYTGNVIAREHLMCYYICGYIE
jgi:hypothetical protein